LSAADMNMSPLASWLTFQGVGDILNLLLRVIKSSVSVCTLRVILTT
jgi:hypothetical protein